MKKNKTTSLAIIGFLVGFLLIFGQSKAQAQSADGFDPNPNNPGLAFAVQPDGKILIGGSFTSIGGQARNRIARLNADGSADLTFNPNANDAIIAIAIQSDGKILIGGTFTSIGGQARNRIARLNADGSVDSTFNRNATYPVFSIAIQSDGKILVSEPQLYSGTIRDLYRLNSDGSLDTTFQATSVNNDVYAIAIQSDGKVLVGGRGFSSNGGLTSIGILRLNVDGSLDTTFQNPNANGLVRSIVIQSDGKILVSGGFTSIGAQRINYVARLNTDGSFDSTFDPNPSSEVYAIAVQSDKKIVVGGIFTSIGGQARNRIARLNTDGSVDLTFNPNADNTILSIVIQSDRKILVGGGFTSIGGKARNYIARLSSAPFTRVSGRVTAGGRGVPKTIVYFTDAQGKNRQARTSSFGYYSFEDVEAGQSYVFQVRAKQYSVAPQVVTITDEPTELNFLASGS